MYQDFLKYLRVARAPEGEVGAGEVVQEEAPASEAPASEAPQGEATASEAPPAEPTIPLSVFQRRVSALTRQKEELQQQIAQLSTTAQPPAAAPQANLAEEARALAAQMAFNEKANAVAAAGTAIAPDFLQRVHQVNAVLGELPQSFIEAVMEAGETHEGAAKLLYDLTGDVQRLAALAAMSPTKQAVALAKIQQEKTLAKKAPPPPRSAPAPIEPKIGGGKAPAPTRSLNDQTLTMEEWARQRNEEIRAKRGW